MTMTPARKTALATVPKTEDFAWPMLRAVHILDGKTASRAELEELAFAYLGLTSAQLAVLKPDRSQTEASNRAWWAMTYLNWVNLVRSANGAWKLMPAGEELFADHVLTDDVKRAAFVHGAVHGAKRAHEGIQTGRIKSRAA
jgi:restriction endonuclease Mrr